ncbi:MAG: V-type ATP synthase subunit H [Candidatus Thermoplasmatota archaeon]|nr:V-type ATP synthase subunit H [Candidatus Thermoplasmatota archaeon]
MEMVKKELEQVKQAEQRAQERIQAARGEAEWIIKKAREKAHREAEAIRQRARQQAEEAVAAARAEAEKEAKKIEKQGTREAERLRQAASDRIQPTAQAVVENILE